MTRYLTLLLRISDYYSLRYIFTKHLLRQARYYVKSPVVKNNLI